MAPVYRVASAACHAIVNDWKQNLREMKTWTARAALQGVRLILFPELNITGYSTGGDLECLSPSHEAVKAISVMAADLSIAIAAGMAWQDEAGTICLVHGIWEPNGSLHLYRKTHLGGREELVYAAGDSLPVFALDGINVGVQMCLEHHFPDIAQTLVLRGAQLILCPHATPRITADQRQSSWHIALRARAYDNCVYLLAANLQGDNGQGLVYPGGAMAIAPGGEVLAEDFSGQAALIIADLDLSQVIDARTTPQGMCRRFYAPWRRKELYE